MKKLIFILSLVALLSNCDNSKKNTAKLSHLIPENSFLILNINDLETFKSDIKNNDFINKFPSSVLKIELSKQLENLKTNNPVLLCFETNYSIINYSIITKYHDSLFNVSETDLRFVSLININTQSL